MSKRHVTFFTEEEIKALANLARVAIKELGGTLYIQEVLASGGKSAFDKLMEKVEEINESKRE